MYEKLYQEGDTFALLKDFDERTRILASMYRREAYTYDEVEEFLDKMTKNFNAFLESKEITLNRIEETGLLMSIANTLPSMRMDNTAYYFC